MKEEGDGVIYSPFNSDEAAGDMKKIILRGQNQLKEECQQPAVMHIKKKWCRRFNWINKISSYLNNILTNDSTADILAKPLPCLVFSLPVVTWFSLSKHLYLLHLYLPLDSGQEEDLKNEWQIHSSDLLVPEVTLANRKEKSPMSIGPLCNSWAASSVPDKETKHCSCKLSLI